MHPDDGGRRDFYVSADTAPYAEGHMRAAEVVDFGLDPGSHLERTGLTPQLPSHVKKGGVPVGMLAKAVKERVVEKVTGAKRCVMS